MSKKKNTLKDLDDFLRQQAAALVSPDKLSDKVPPTEAARRPEAESSTQPLTRDAIISSISENADYRNQLCDIILGVSDSITNPTIEDKMLINTALYLKHGERWKDAIRDFWKKRR
jgi:hypothetical protein